MPPPTKVVAVLTENPALSSILTVVLASRPDLRVRQFEHLDALAAYARVAPLDAVVLDYRIEGRGAPQLATRLRAELPATRAARIVALAADVTAEMREDCRRAGVDEVIVKPMSPRFLEERVRALLARPAAAERALAHGAGPDRRGGLAIAAHAGKVVPLFADSPAEAPT